MGRLAVDETDDGTFIYVVGRERIFRYRWVDRLELDHDWQPQYRSDSIGVQGLAWDVSLVDGYVWLHDNGDVFGVRALFSGHPNRLPLAIDERAAPDLPVPWTGAQRIVRVSAVDASDVAAFEPFGDPGGWVLAPPLVHDGVVVTWDCGNRRLAAFRSDSDGKFERLWEKPFRQTIQPMVYSETRELVVNDAQARGDTLKDDVVVLDLDSGHEKGRVQAGARGNGMFFCPGWERDLYYCTWFKVAHVRVSDLKRAG